MKVRGLRYHRETVKFATKPPAEAVGPYAFQTYITKGLGCLIASLIVSKLNNLGYKGIITTDLLGTGSLIANPYGYIEDIFANRFAAVAAGLGVLTKSGRIATDEFGIRQRFIAIITDASMEPNALIKQKPQLCYNCRKCIDSCPVSAFTSQKISFMCEGVSYSFYKRDINRCDWSKRYALAGNSGFKYLGSKVNEIPDGEITKEKLTNALKKHDPITMRYILACEPCMINCPYSL